MVKNLVIHLGDVKAGSTSIQNTLYEKTWVSNSTTLICPGGPNHYKLANAVKNSIGAENITDRAAPLVQAFADSNADVGVLTAELFQSCDPVEFKEMIANNFPEHLESVRLICYLRPHIDRTLSMYAQNVKRGKFSGTLNGYHNRQMKRGAFMYSDGYNKWKEVFGDQFTLRPMVRETLFENCVVRDFLNFALNGQPFKLTKEPNHNPSMSVKELSVIRELHFIFESPKKISKIQQRLGGHFSRLLVEGRPEDQEKVALHEGLVEKIIEDYTEDAKLIDDAFFTDAPMTKSLISYRSKAIAKQQSIKLDKNFGPVQAHSIRALCMLIRDMSTFKPDKLSAHIVQKTNKIFSNSSGN